MSEVFSTSLSSPGMTDQKFVSAESHVREGVPIIFVHQRYSPYLEFTLRQAAYTNEGSPIHLLGDAENDRFDFLEHNLIGDFSSSGFDEFKSVYKHDSPNGFEYELFCFQRWFLVRELMAQRGYGQVLVADSDVMIYSDVTMLAEKMGLQNNIALLNIGADCDWVRSASGHSSYWSWEGINLFCELAIHLYTNSRLIDFMQLIKAEKINRNDKAGISDMTALYVFYQEYRSRIGNLSVFFKGGTFDHNIAMATNFNLEEYITRGGLKKVDFQLEHPVCYNQVLNQAVTMHTLHFQGGSKNVIHRYYTGKGLLVARFYRELRYWISRAYRIVF